MKKRLLSLLLVLVLILGIVPMASASAFTTEPMVAGSGDYGVGLRNDGTVWQWDSTTPPTRLSNLSNIVAIAGAPAGMMGQDQRLALRNDGTVWQWSSFTPLEQVQGLNNVTAIALGTDHSVALRSDGTVWTWGSNRMGQLGHGTTRGNYPVPAQVPNLNNVTGVAAGNSYTMALRSDGTVWAWGLRSDSDIPVQIQNFSNIVAIVNGVALRNDGTVWEWRRRDSAEQVEGLSNITEIAVSTSYYIALRDDGTVWEWGTRWVQEPPFGESVSVSPIQNPHLRDVTSIAIGGFSTSGMVVSFSVALRDDGSVWQWNWNYRASEASHVTTPVRVPGSGGTGFLNLGTVPQPSRTPFTDVSANAWYEDGVEFVFENNIMQGTSPTTFAPANNFNREMVVATLFRMYHGRPADSRDSSSTPFTDVSGSAWFAPYVSWAVANGLVQGTTATTFGTGNAVSRQDFAVLMYRYANFLGENTSVPSGFNLNFPDTNRVGSWAEESLRWAVHNGLITGTGGMLAPTGTASRAQSATILMRYVQTVAN